MGTRTRIALATLAMLAFIPASSEGTTVEARIKPKPVHPGDKLRVRFESPRKVKPRFHLRYSVLSGSEGNIFTCTLAKVVQSNKHPKKGERVTTYIKPKSESGVTDKWCVGDGTVFVSYVRNSDNKGGGTLAIGSFKIRRP
jgi:hypothetical protein